MGVGLAILGIMVGFIYFGLGLDCACYVVSRDEFDTEAGYLAMFIFVVLLWLPLVLFYWLLEKLGVVDAAD